MENNNSYSDQFNILLADDDKDDCLFFKDALEELAIVTTFAAVHDGEQLMDFLLNQKNKRPSVLFLDLNMPRKDGFTCLVEIKSIERLQQIPIIIFSTSYDKGTLKRLYNTGARHYISKPANFSDLKKIIIQAIHLISEGKNKQTSFEQFLLKI